MDKSGTAFPASPQYAVPHEATIVSLRPGMTLRQWYAGMALTGIMGNSNAAFDQPWQAHAAKDAFQLADAMIAEGEK